MQWTFVVVGGGNLLKSLGYDGGRGMGDPFGFAHFVANGTGVLIFDAGWYCCGLW